MKKHFLLFGLLILATITFAQAPQAFNYQAVIRDADGNLLENQAVGIKISLLQGSATGQEVYAETHTTTTNQFGQVDLKIGTGTIVVGQFNTISWASDPYYLQLAVDLTGGANYAVMGTTQMLSVPYALYAEEGSGWEKTENGIGFRDGKVIIGTENPVKELTINGDLFIKKTTAGNDTMSIYLFEEGFSGICLNYLAPENRLDINGSYDNAQSNIMTITRAGKVGIGVDTPVNKLDVNGTIGLSKLEYFNKQNGDNYMNIQGTQSINQWLRFRLGGDPPIGRAGITFSSYDQVHTFLCAFGDGFRINQSLEVSETPNFANSVTRMIITNAGNVGIGTINPTYPLTVNGTIRSKKVIVDTGWSDFVFEDDYSLMPLHSLAKFIEKNNHLPEMPTAKEVESNGISLGEMDAKLLQKIEELTLYVIELKMENEQQQQLIEEQSKQLKKLEKRHNR